MRGSILFVLLGIAIAVNGCGGSTNGGAGGATGKGGSGGGGAGTTGGAGVGGQGGGSAGTAGGGTAGTGGAPACGTADRAELGATCNVVVAAGGPCVTATFSTAAPPTPAGGVFAGGTYNLVSQTFYGSAAIEMAFSPGVPFRQTYVLSDVTSTSFTLDQIATTGTIVARAHETAAVSGMTATFTQTCPAPDGGIDGSGSTEFTATSSSITLFWSSTLFQSTEVLTEVTVYNKAP